MRIKKVVKSIAATPQALDEIRQENRAYFTALAEEIGERAAREAEQQYLKEIAAELETIGGSETVEVVMVQI